MPATADFARPSMIRRRWYLTLTVWCVVTSPALAEDPALVVQTAPAGKLLDTFVKAANRMQPPAARHPPVTENQMLRELFGTDDLGGLDRDRPIGLFVEPDVDLAQTRIVLAVPVTDADQFRGLLGRTGIRPAKDQSGDGIEGFAVPNIAAPVFLRFHERYAYICPGSREALDPKRLPAAATALNAKEPNAVVARLRLDRVSATVWQQVLDLWHFEVKALAASAGPPATQALAKGLTEWVGRSGRAAFADGKEAVLRFDLDPWTETYRAGLRLEAKPGTPLAADIANYKPPTNRFAGLAGPAALGSILVRAPLSAPELRSLLDTWLGTADSQPGEAAPDAVLVEGAKALRRSIQAGELAFGAGAYGPDRNGHITLVYGLTLSDTGPVEKAFRRMAGGPQRIPNAYKIDAETAGTIAVHQFNFLAALPPPLADPVTKTFGDGWVRVAFAPDAALFAMGPDSLVRLTEVIAMKPQPAPLVDMIVSAKRLVQLLGHINPGAVEGLKRYFGDIDRLTMWRLSADGGTALTVHFAFSTLLTPRMAAPSPAPRAPPTR